MYLIPKELNSKIKIFKNLHLKEFFLFIVGMGIVFLFDSLVYSKFTIIYYLFSTFAIIFMLLPARHNPDRCNYEAIYYTFIRERIIFHPISREEIEENKS
ncbi:DUF5592 family protein [Clostridium sp. SHJSY1]|uniref:DUF5592 family protein n=1 Tax=Clostridium sp. SHJSY1 TaxID=2942483 RepID=UPI002873FDB8|nr:DUF5592 family protein [Clostridium sp. SHJSY1]MDS0528317.1 DUF5592 family protein [Clostridium sp. SHJSY1]